MKNEEQSIEVIKLLYCGNCFIAATALYTGRLSYIATDSIDHQKIVVLHLLIIQLLSPEANNVSLSSSTPKIHGIKLKCRVCNSNVCRM